MAKQSKIPLHKNDDRQKEFSLMSKGIGANYLTKQKIQWHKKNMSERMYIPIEDGKKIAMPRYYKDKIYTETEKSVIAYHMAIEAKKTHNKQLQDIILKCHCSVEEAEEINYQNQTSIMVAKFKNYEKRNQTGRDKL